MEEKILEAGGLALRTQQASVKDLKAAIDSAYDRQTKSEVLKAKLVKDVAKLVKSIEASTIGLKLTQGELDALLEQIGLTSSDSGAVRQNVEQAEEVLSEKRDELSEMKKVLDEKLVVITQFRKREVSI